MGTRQGRRLAIASVVAVVALVGALAWVGWSHIEFMLAFKRLGRNAQGYAEYRHRQTGIVFVALSGGTFLMGSPEDEEGRDQDEGPVHEVTLSPFLISKYEVTQAQWEALMGSNPSSFKGEHRPVERISWDDCQEFCAMTGLGLPTEAQWEFACRAGTSGPYSGTGRLEDVTLFPSRETHTVGQTVPNQFGIFEMHGNVAEWCLDVWVRDAYQGKKPSSGNSTRVLRGGGYASPPSGLRSGNRSYWLASNEGPDCGFRPVFRIESR